MITVSFSEIASNKLHLAVIGHSSANRGKDIVCSAVSALTQTFLRGIEKNLEAKFNGLFQSGECNLLIEVPVERSQEFGIICKIFKDGFQEIAKSYSEQVKLN